MGCAAHAEAKGVLPRIVLFFYIRSAIDVVRVVYQVLALETDFVVFIAIEARLARGD